MHNTCRVVYDWLWTERKGLDGKLRLTFRCARVDSALLRMDQRSGRSGAEEMAGTAVVARAARRWAKLAGAAVSFLWRGWAADRRLCRAIKSHSQSTNKRGYNPLTDSSEMVAIAAGFTRARL